MKQFKYSFMCRHTTRGFTLMEILLALMIVGLIGISLAALTRSAGRETSLGRNKILLRNRLSAFARTLREDFATASEVRYIKGIIDASEINEPVLLFQLAKNTDGQRALNAFLPVEYITYCFAPGAQTTKIVPTGSTRGGVIYRGVTSGEHPGEMPNVENIPTTCPNGNWSTNGYQPVLPDVKFIPDTEEAYPVPLFQQTLWGADDDGEATLNQVEAKIIVEIENQVIENELLEITLTGPFVRTSAS